MLDERELGRMSARVDEIERMSKRMDKLERAELYWWLLFCGAALVLFVAFIVTDSIQDRLRRIEATLTRIEATLDRRQ